MDSFGWAHFRNSTAPHLRAGERKRIPSQARQWRHCREFRTSPSRRSTCSDTNRSLLGKKVDLLQNCREKACFEKSQNVIFAFINKPLLGYCWICKRWYTTSSKRVLPPIFETFISKIRQFGIGFPRPYHPNPHKRSLEWNNSLNRGKVV